MARAFIFASMRFAFFGGIIFSSTGRTASRTAKPVSFQELADEDYVRHSGQTILSRKSGRRNAEAADIGAAAFLGDEGAVDYRDPAGLHSLNKLIVARSIHRNEDIRVGDIRRAYRLVAHADGAVSGAAAHLRAVGGQPRYLLAPAIKPSVSAAPFPRTESPVRRSLQKPYCFQPSFLYRASSTS